MFDFDHTHLSDLSDLAPKLKWIQAYSAGVGQLVRQYEYAQRMPELIVTTARAKFGATHRLTVLVSSGGSTLMW